MDKTDTDLSVILLINQRIFNADLVSRRKQLDDICQELKLEGKTVTNRREFFYLKVSIKTRRNISNMNQTFRNRMNP